MSTRILPKRMSGHQVTVDGFLVPRVEVSENVETGLWTLFLDGIYGSEEVSLEELHRWIWLIANAMAIGGNYSCHGENSVYRPNPYKLKVMEIC